MGGVADGEDAVAAHARRDHPPHAERGRRSHALARLRLAANGHRLAQARASRRGGVGCVRGGVPRDEPPPAARQRKRLQHAGGVEVHSRDRGVRVDRGGRIRHQVTVRILSPCERLGAIDEVASAGTGRDDHDACVALGDPPGDGGAHAHVVRRRQRRRHGRRAHRLGCGLCEHGLGRRLRQCRDEWEPAREPLEPHHAEHVAAGPRLAARDACGGGEQPLGEARRLEGGQHRGVHADRACAAAGGRATLEKLHVDTEARQLAGQQHPDRPRADHDHLTHGPTPRPAPGTAPVSRPSSAPAPRRGRREARPA